MSSKTNSTGSINAVPNNNTLSIGSMDYQIMFAVERNDGAMHIICTQDALHPPKVISSVSCKGKAKVDCGETLLYLTNDALQQSLRGCFDPQIQKIFENCKMKHSEIRCFYRVVAIFDPNGAVFAECSRITADVCKTETYRFLDHPQRSEWTIELIMRAVIEDGHLR